MAEPIQIGEGRAGNRRVLVLAAVAAAILLGVVVLPGLLFSDSSSPSTDEAFPPVAPGVTATTVEATDPPAETFEVFSSTNPFTPLVEVAPPAGVPVSESTPVVEIDEDTPTPTFPPFTEEETRTFPEDGDGSGAAPPGATTTTAPPAPARQPDRVGMLEVFTDAGGQVVASVRVNDITYQVAEGDDFATSYRVVELDVASRCGQLLFGDDQFRLCEGDEVLK